MRFKTHTHNTGRIPRNNGIGWNVTRNDGTRANNCAVTYANARHDQGLSADPYIIANDHVTFRMWVARNTPGCLFPQNRKRKGCDPVDPVFTTKENFYTTGEGTKCTNGEFFALPPLDYSEAAIGMRPDCVLGIALLERDFLAAEELPNACRYASHFPDNRHE